MYIFDLITVRAPNMLRAFHHAIEVCEGRANSPAFVVSNLSRVTTLFIYSFQMINMEFLGETRYSRILEFSFLSGKAQ